MAQPEASDKTPLLASYEQPPPQQQPPPPQYQAQPQYVQQQAYAQPPPQQYYQQPPPMAHQPAPQITVNVSQQQTTSRVPKEKKKKRKKRKKTQVQRRLMIYSLTFLIFLCPLFQQQVIVVENREVNHCCHFLLFLFTGTLWLPFWVCAIFHFILDTKFIHAFFLFPFFPFLFR